MKTVNLGGNVSLIEAMRRIHASPGTILIKAKRPKTNRGEAEYWQLLFTGGEPNFAGLLPVDQPERKKRVPVFVSRGFDDE